MARKLHFAGDPERAREPEFVTRARKALGLPMDATLVFERKVEDAQGGLVLEYTVTNPVTLDGAEFGPASGITVDERATARLRFDGTGTLVSSQVSPADPRRLRLVKDQVRKLAAAGDIARRSPAASRTKKPKPWYVEKDAQGRKRLKRALIS